MIKSFFAAIGFVVCLLGILGANGVGCFRIYYGPQEVKLVPIEGGK